MKVDILAIGIHPDDVELSCSGTLAKHIAMGKAVGILDLTKGELGTRGGAALRVKEAKKAAEVLGAKFRVQLDLKDGFFENDEKSRLKLIEQLRQFRPEIVLCNAISDRHPDHGRSARLVADACFYSGLIKIRTKHKGKEQQAWRPKAVYHYIQDQFMHPDFVVDVTDYIDIKHRSIMAFASQFYDPKSKEPETPISGKDFLENVNAKMSVWGRPIGARYAEGFISSRYIGVQDLFDLI